MHEVSEVCICINVSSPATKEKKSNVAHVLRKKGFEAKVVGGGIGHNNGVSDIIFFFDPTRNLRRVIGPDGLYAEIGAIPGVGEVRIIKTYQPD